MSTAFDYLLNQLEHASQADRPADHGYAEKRERVLGYVEALREVADARGDLLSARERRDRVEENRATEKATSALRRLTRIAAQAGLKPAPTGEGTPHA